MLNVNASVDAAVQAAVLFEVVCDLGTYPGWLDIVGRATPEDDAADVGPHADEPPVWLVDLRAQLGPLRRSKRLRMERTVCEYPRMARFERRELDGRSHSPWILTAVIDDTGDTASLTMDLHYGGSLWLPALDRILGDEIRRSSRRLVDLVEARD